MLATLKVESQRTLEVSGVGAQTQGQPHSYGLGETLDQHVEKALALYFSSLEVGT